MEIDQSTDGVGASGSRGTSPLGTIRKIFFNAEGMRAGWRFLIYVLFVVGLFMGLKIVLMHFVKSTPGVVSIKNWFLAEVVGFVAAFGAAIIMSFIERRPVGVYGLPVRGAFGKLFWQGCLLGLLHVSLLVGLIHLFGGYSFGNLELHGTEILHWGALWAIFFVFVGLFEEFLFRGYSLYTLTDGVGFWPAAVLLSLFFAAVHLQNNGEGKVGVAAVFLVGLLFCLTIRRTGTLWFAVGMHAAFDFAETFLYSVPDSGMVFPGHLSNASLHGKAWLTGGTAGPEASVFDFLILLVFFYVIHRLYPANRMPTPDNGGGAYRTGSETATTFNP
jgi:membrane protease YdiL (CAAX protease family)